MQWLIALLTFVPEPVKVAGSQTFCEAFLFSLRDYIKDDQVSHELPTTLDGVNKLATRIDL